MQNVVKTFPNIKQFFSYLESGKTQSAFKDILASQLTTETKAKDSKTKNYSEANDLLLYGDKETAQKINDSGLAKIRCNIANDMKRRVIYSGVVGFAPNVPAYLAGSPASMIAAKQERKKEKVINLHYNISVSWTVPAAQIITAASRFLSAVCKIEAGGVRVNLTCGDAVYASGKDSQLVTNVVKIKDSKEKLDVLKVAYPLVHPSMLRRHCFRFLEITEGLDRRFADGYGRGVESKIVKKLLNENKCKCDCVLRYKDIEGLTVDAIIKRIEKELSTK